MKYIENRVRVWYPKVIFLTQNIESSLLSLFLFYFPVKKKQDIYINSTSNKKEMRSKKIKQLISLYIDPLYNTYILILYIYAFFFSFVWKVLRTKKGYILYIILKRLICYKFHLYMWHFSFSFFFFVLMIMCVCVSLYFHIIKSIIGLFIWKSCLLEVFG